MRWRRRRTDEDFGAEVRAHLENEADRLVGEGMTPEEARAAAHRQFGNVTRARERFHDAHRSSWLEQFGQDLRYAWRGLWQSRAFVATTVLTLAVGMGLVTVVFAVFNAYVLRPFAVHDPYSLYAISWRSQEAGGSTFRWRDYQDFQTRQDLFDGAVAEAMRDAVSGERHVATGFVSGNYFEVLGARVALGRALMSDDARAPGGEPVAVLTDSAWARLFDRDPAVLGRELDVNGQKLVIVGVMAGEFVGLDDAPRDIWVPITMYGAVSGDDLFRGANQPRQVRVTARLRHGVTPQQAQDRLALEPFETRVAGRLDAVRASLQLRATPARITLTGLALPVAGVRGLCTGARGGVRQRVERDAGPGKRPSPRDRHSAVDRREPRPRGATTGDRRPVDRCRWPALAGIALAGALLRVGIFLLVAMLPPTVALRVRLVPLDFDYRVFLFAFVVAGASDDPVRVGAGAPSDAIDADRRACAVKLSGTIRSSSLRNWLITSQVAVSLVLLIVAVTLVRNGTAIRATDLGLDTRGVISVRPGHADKALMERTYTRADS